MRTFYEKAGTITTWNGEEFKMAHKLQDRLKLEHTPAPVWCEEEKCYLIGTGYANFSYTPDGKGVWVNEYKKEVRV